MLRMDSGAPAMHRRIIARVSGVASRPPGRVRRRARHATRALPPASAGRAPAAAVSPVARALATACSLIAWSSSRGMSVIVPIEPSRVSSTVRATRRRSLEVRQQRAHTWAPPHECEQREEERSGPIPASDTADCQSACAIGPFQGGGGIVELRLSRRHRVCSHRDRAGVVPARSVDGLVVAGKHAA